VYCSDRCRWTARRDPGYRDASGLPGQPPAPFPTAVRAAITAYLDRAPVEVLSSTLAPGYIGLYLVEIRLPAIVNAGPAELYITADGQESNRVRIQLEP